MKLSVGHLLVPPLLLFYCSSLAAVPGKGDADNQHNIYNTSPRLGGMRSELKINEEKSKDHSLTSNSSRADFLCPASEAIAPCTCTASTIDCTDVESLDQLVAVFQQDFPVKELYQFAMGNNNAITELTNFMNGYTFEIVNLNPGPFILSGISDQFLIDLKDTLMEFNLCASKLTTDLFPFSILPSMNQLQSLLIYTSDINRIPQIQAPKLTHFTLELSLVELLEIGTFPIGTGQMNILLYGNLIHTIEVGSIFFVDQNSADSNELIHIDVSGNQLQSLQAGSFPWRNGNMYVQLLANQISYIEPGTFVLPASTDLLVLSLDLGYNQLTTLDEAVFGSMMPFFSYLGLQGNPLTCGCDVAWLVLNPDFLARVDDFATCADGTNLHALDPQPFIDNC